KINIPEANIHFMAVNLKPKEAAVSYDKELAEVFEGETPQFDLILLGLGTNGHTASLFPNSSILSEKKMVTKSVYVEEEKMYRLSMTAPLINNAKQILFLVSGEKKAAILKTVLTGAHEPALYPAQLIKPTHGEICWFADKDAAADL
ncbi:MAG: 6-phosphogluconolactonase, partial [Bacteroidia bacterium]